MARERQRKVTKDSVESRKIDSKIRAKGAKSSGAQQIIKGVKVSNREEHRQKKR